MVVHRGKIATHPEILEVRPLAREDLGILLAKRTDGEVRGGSGAVARFRDPHHRVARLFAAGLRIGEVVARSGYSYQRVFTLRADPAFEDLIAKYREKIDANYLSRVDDFYEEATANMRKAERMIAERLEKADEEDIDLPLNLLASISGDRMDRFGYGKRQTNININADFAAHLEKTIKRSGKTIEATGPSKALPQPVAESASPSLPQALIETKSTLSQSEPRISPPNSTLARPLSVAPKIQRRA